MFDELNSTPPQFPRPGDDSLRTLVVYEHDEPCPYLPGELARLPLRLPARRVTPEQFDQCLAAGDRRTGIYLYRTACRRCDACQPIRLDTTRFSLRGSHRRVLKRCRDVRVEIAEPTADSLRVALFNRHRHERDLENGPPIDEEAYQGFLVETCCDTVEMSYWAGQQLVGVAIVDVGAQALSAVYCYFDPDFSKLSPGTYSILQQLELCRRWSRRYLYLGFYVEDCPAMRYKAQWLPHERRIAGQWQEFTASHNPD